MEIILKELWLNLRYLTLQMGENQQEKDVKQIGGYSLTFFISCRIHLPKEM
jgi:hypothetical protein